MDGAGMRVLVVEDTALLKKMCDNYLKKHGFEVLLAGSADEAMAAVETQAPHIILLDLGLPDRDGMDVLAEVQQYDATIQVIVMTAKTSVDVAVRAMKLGAVDFVTKPVDFAHSIMV